MGQRGAGSWSGWLHWGRRRGAACCVCSGGLWIQGWEELLRLWGQRWERLPGPALGPAPSNGRIPCYSQTLSLPNGLKKLLPKNDIIDKYTYELRQSKPSKKVENFRDRWWRKIDLFVVPSVTSSFHHSRCLFITQRRWWRQNRPHSWGWGEVGVIGRGVHEL